MRRGLNGGGSLPRVSNACMKTHGHSTTSERIIHNGELNPPV
jgi:hypothetical protein